MIGLYNRLLSKVFRFHYHSQKVIGSLWSHFRWFICVYIYTNTYIHTYMHIHSPYNRKPQKSRSDFFCSPKKHAMRSMNTKPWKKNTTVWTFFQKFSFRKNALRSMTIGWWWHIWPWNGPVKLQLTNGVAVQDAPWKERWSVCTSVEECR